MTAIPMERDRLNGQLVLFAPAVALLVLISGALPSPVATLVGLAAMFFAPGFLLWLALPRPIVRDAAALPAVWFVASFAVLLPTLLVMTVFHTPVEVVTWGLVAELSVLGWLAARRGRFPARRPRHPRWTVAASLLLLGLAVLSVFLARPLYDDLVYAGMVNAVSSQGSFPSTNPFLGLDLPLNPRWGLDGWTAALGSLVYLSDIDALVLLRQYLPPVLLVAAASAAYLIGRYLMRSERFGLAAATTAAVLPLLADPGANPSLFLFAYRGIQEDKYVALLVFFPVVFTFFLATYHGPRRYLALASAVLLLALFLVHPLVAIFVPLVMGFYVLVHSLLNRVWRPTPVVWVGAAVLPTLVLGVIVSVRLNDFGVALSDIDAISQVAAERRAGPLTYWEPSAPVAYFERPANEAVSALVTVRLTRGQLPRMLFFDGDVMIVNPARLGTLMYLPVALGVLLMLLRQRKRRLTAFVVASTLPVLLLTLAPGVANLAGLVVTPFQVWRFVWLLPITLSAAWLFSVWAPRASPASLLAASFLVALIVVETSHSGLFDLTASQDSEFKAEVNQLGAYQGVLLAPRNVGDFVSAEPRGLRPIAYRGPQVMSDAFPRELQAEAYHRMRDRDRFYKGSITLDERLRILRGYGITHVLTYRGNTSSLMRSERESIGEIAAVLKAGDLPLEQVADLGDTFMLHKVVARRPAAVEVLPEDRRPTVGVATTIAATYTDGNGWRDIQRAYLLVNTTWDPDGACYVRFDPKGKRLFLRRDEGGWLNAGSPGAGSVVQNSRCALDGGGSRVSGSAKEMTVKFALRFKASFAGTHNLYLRSRDNSGLLSSKYMLESLRVTAPK